MIILLLQTKALHEVVPINQGHICKGQPQEFHVFSMKSSDYNAKAFLGRLCVDVTIHQERRQSHQMARLSPLGQISSIFMQLWGKCWPNIVSKAYNIDIDIVEKKSSGNIDSKEQVYLSYHFQRNTSLSTP